MKINTQFFLDPGGANEGISRKRTEDDNEIKDTDETTPLIEEDGDNKTVGEKIKDALQDWSNKDQADQDFDDTRV
ncbi:MAG: hypothetical protein Q7T76_03805 [Ferruginibacter sp.]|nr:hypothetical protein [Ferruginibacter sp.]